MKLWQLATLLMVSGVIFQQTQFFDNLKAVYTGTSANIERQGQMGQTNGQVIGGVFGEK